MSLGAAISFVSDKVVIKYKNEIFTDKNPLEEQYEKIRAIRRPDYSYEDFLKEIYSDQEVHPND